MTAVNEGRDGQERDEGKKIATAGKEDVTAGRERRHGRERGSQRDEARRPKASRSWGLGVWCGGRRRADVKAAADRPRPPCGRVTARKEGRDGQERGM